MKQGNHLIMKWLIWSRGLILKIKFIILSAISTPGSKWLLFLHWYRTIENRADDRSYKHTDDERDDYQKNRFPEIEREENDIGWFNGDDAGEDYFGNEQDAQDFQEYD